MDLFNSSRDSSDSSGYFESYDNLEVHQLMLQDAPRNKAYKDALMSNKCLIKDKVVLDVGAGTGILSIICAQAGAKMVYAVEASNIYKVAEELVKENHFENVVQVMNCLIEEVKLPEKVDVIVSEWMGFYLLHEGMLDSVLVARDKFLKPGGYIFPESATLYAAPCSVPSMYDFWDNVNGLSMKSLGSKLRENASKKPLTEIVPSDALLADPEVVMWIDLREVCIDSINSVSMRHVAVANKKGKYQGICIWFSCTFPSTIDEPVILSTDPNEQPTHWKQTLIVLPSEEYVDIYSPITYDLSFIRSPKNSRWYTIDVDMLNPSDIDHPEYCFCNLTRCILVRALLEKYETEN